MRCHPYSFSICVALGLLLSFASGASALVAGDVDNSGAVDAMDVQLVINGALSLAVPYSTDIDYSGKTDAMDVQLVINAALAISIDTDKDGLCNMAEAKFGTDPAKPDTDGDGISDGQEALDGTDPLIADTPASPSVVAFLVDNGADSTASPTVTLNNTCTGSPTHYMASELADFSDTTWQAYSAAPSFMLSSGNGTKTVWFKVKNAAGESNMVSDTITLNESTGTEGTVLLPGGVPLVMVWCPAGTFMMGRYAGEQNSYTDEDPQHSVTLSGFWMGKYELTKRQWVAVMGTTPWSGGYYVLDDLDSPAVYVSWNDAKAFVTELNGLTGKTFRLPSEAQWEYACRAGTTTRFYWGDDPSYTVINDYAWNWGNCSSEMYAHVVGQKLPNAFGLYDMIGNVWEFCEDDWHDDYTGAPTDGSAWVDSPRGSYRVFRGGSWDLNAVSCRSAHRYTYNPDNAYHYYGFRVVRTP